MRNFLKSAGLLIALLAAVWVQAESPDELRQPPPRPSIPTGPRPTATVTPLESTPEPTNTVTPLPSASPSGTQPPTTNTVTPSPSPTPPQAATN